MVYFFAVVECCWGIHVETVFSPVPVVRCSLMTREVASHQLVQYIRTSFCGGDDAR